MGFSFREGRGGARRLARTSGIRSLASRQPHPTVVHSPSLPPSPSLQVFALTFCLLAVVTCKNMYWLRGTPLPPSAVTAPARLWNAALAALILTILALALSAAWSLAVLIRTTLKKEKMGGFSYGTLLASSFGLPFLLITTGVLLNALTVAVAPYERAQVGWSKSDSSVFNATMAFSFILAGLYIIYTTLLAVFRGAFVPSLGGVGRGGTTAPGTPAAAGA
jgi:hypothetical protein